MPPDYRQVKARRCFHMKQRRLPAAAYCIDVATCCKVGPRHAQHDKTSQGVEHTTIN